MPLVLRALLELPNLPGPGVDEAAGSATGPTAIPYITEARSLIAQKINESLLAHYYTSSLPSGESLLEDTQVTSVVMETKHSRSIHKPPLSGSA